MPIELVDSLVEASPSAVVASLTGMLRRFGWTLTGVGDFGRSVTWRAFDSSLELVDLRAEVLDVPGRPGLVRLRISRVDEALSSTLDRVATPPLPRRDTRSAG